MLANLMGLLRGWTRLRTVECAVIAAMVLLVTVDGVAMLSSHVHISYNAASTLAAVRE